ncbi:sel1 repeat family protein, partial [Planctomycetota bacterium]|nr:sel1 repeat family protein [Planctomycetota bacterium]
DFGEGVREDKEEGVRWYRLAAEQGDASAQWRLGLAYEAGEGLPVNPSKARSWIDLAAEQGHEFASEWLENRKDRAARESAESEGADSDGDGGCSSALGLGAVGLLVWLTFEACTS